MADEPVTNTQIWQDTKQAVTDLEAQVKEAIGNLVSLADSLADPWDFIRVPEEREYVYNPNDIEAPNLPEFNRPTFVFNPKDYVDDGGLVTYKYESEFFQFLDPQLRDSILNETVGISTTIQQAIFDAMRDRDIQTLNDALDATDRVQARRGFPIPDQMMLAARSDVIKKYQDTANDRNREVTKLIAERAQANVHHAIDAGIKMEDINSRFQMEYFRMFFTMADVLIRKYEAEMRAALAEFEANSKEAIYQFEADKVNRGLDMETSKVRIDRLRAYIDQNYQRARIAVDQAKTGADTQLGASRDVVNYYQSKVSGYLSQINAVNIVNA